MYTQAQTRKLYIYIMGEGEGGLFRRTVCVDSRKRVAGVSCVNNNPLLVFFVQLSNPWVQGVTL